MTSPVFPNLKFVIPNAANPEFVEGLGEMRDLMELEVITSSESMLN